MGFFALLWIDHRLWFGGDEWAMVSRATSAPTLQNLFAPHNEHWSTVVVLEYRVLLAVFGLRSYIPYLVVLIGAVVLLAHLLWRLMLRAGVDEWMATVLAGVFVVLGSGAQALQNAFNFSFVGAVCAGTAALLLVAGRDPLGWRRILLVEGLLLFALMCSAPAVAMVFAVGLLALLRRGWRSALELVTLPAVVYVVWFVAIGHEGTSKDFLLTHALPEVPGYVLTGIASVFSLNTGWSQVALHLHLGGTTIVGGLLALCLFGWLILHRREATGLWAPAFAGAAGAVFFYLVVAFARTRFGTSQADQTRYVFVAVALLLPSFGLALTRVGARLRSTAWNGVVPVAALVLFALTNFTQLYSSAGNLAADSRVNRDKVYGAASLIRSGSPIVDGHIIPSSSYLTTQVIRAGLIKGWFGSLAWVSEADRIDARSILQVSTTSSPSFGRAPGSVTDVDIRGFSSQDPPSGSCVSFTSFQAPKHTISFPVNSPTSLGLDLSQNTSLQLVLSSEGDARARSQPRTIKIRRDHLVFLNFLSGGVQAKLILPARDGQVCGSQPENLRVTQS